MVDQTVQNIKDRLNIVDVVGGYVQLKKAGVNFRALCPFHSERTPSFNVNPQRQIWHCFGCSEGGDIFGFVMRYENVDFREALKILAQKAGVRLPEYSPKDPKVQEEKDLLLRINAFAAKAFHQALLKDQGASDYLSKRGLTLGTIKQWQIGFAPLDFHFLHRALLAKNISEANLIKAGVCVKGEKGNVYDRFRGRITFPIYNYFGEPVGFSARILPALEDAKSAKYINSPETPVYKKSEVLFGLNFAKDKIRKKDEMVVVEGQMDCVSLHQAGFKNVIASSGTAYNEQTVGFTLARRLTKNIKLCFDSDAAGQLALKKAGQMLLKAGFRIKVIILKTVKDPDELVRKSPGLWEKAVSEAQWFLDFYIYLATEKFPNDPVEQKHYLSEEVVPFLGLITDQLEQDHYIGLLIKKYGISEKAIRQQLSGKMPMEQNALSSQATLPPHKDLALEKEVLGGLAINEKFRKSIQPDIEESDFENSEIRQIALALVLELSGNQPTESTLAKESSFMVESILEQLGPEAFLKRLLKSYSQLKVNNLKKKQKFLQNEIARTEQSPDKAPSRKLQEDFAAVSKSKMEWERK